MEVAQRALILPYGPFIFKVLNKSNSLTQLTEDVGQFLESVEGGPHWQLHLLGEGVNLGDLSLQVGKSISAYSLLEFFQGWPSGAPHRSGFQLHVSALTYSSIYFASVWMHILSRSLSNSCSDVSTSCVKPKKVSSRFVTEDDSFLT